MLKHIILYYSPFDSASAELRYLLKSLQLRFEEYDVISNKEAAKEAQEKSGQLGLPVIIIDGEIIIGFDQEKILKTLQKTNYLPHDIKNRKIENIKKLPNTKTFE